MSPGHELMQLLTHAVRLLMIEQVADLCRDWNVAPAPLIRSLQTAGWLSTTRLLSHPRLPLQEPLATWSPGQAAPHFGAVSYRARRRWRHACRPVAYCLATERGAALFGGRGGRLKNPLQATHDAHVAEVLLVLRRSGGLRAGEWVGEDGLPSSAVDRHGRRPDAALLDDHGGVVCAVEFVGAYPAPRIASVHHECERKGWNYALW